MGKSSKWKTINFITFHVKSPAGTGSYLIPMGVRCGGPGLELGAKCEITVYQCGVRYRNAYIHLPFSADVGFDFVLVPASGAAGPLLTQVLLRPLLESHLDCLFPKRREFL